MPYAKLDSGITTSSVWSEELHVRVVWVSFLAAKDENGVVWGSRPGLARMCNVTIEQYDDATTVLASPDPDSKTPDNEGRRIAAVDGGWLILNHDLYRLPEDQRRIATRERVKRYRALHSVTGALHSVTGALHPVSVSESVSEGGEGGVAFVQPSPKAVMLADEFRVAHQMVNPSARSTAEHKRADAVEMEQVLGTDGRTVEEVRKAISAVFGDKFWCHTIHTVGMLRAKWNDGKLQKCLNGGEVLTTGEIEKRAELERDRDAVRKLRESYGLDP